MSPISIAPLPPAAALRILIDPAPAPPSSAPVDAAWALLCAANPRLFDGPILSVTRSEPARAVIRCRRDSYRRLAVRPTVPTYTSLLSVSGVLRRR